MRIALWPLLLAAAVALGCCSTSADKRGTGAGERAAADPKPSREFLSAREGKATITTRSGQVFRLNVEIASDDESRARGLMFRKSLPEMAGMIFVFPERRINSFWMKNTLIPLDMLFIDSDDTVVGIVEMAEPLTTTPRSVREPSNRVLEVNGGWCGHHGVAAGDKVELEGMFELR